MYRLKLKFKEIGHYLLGGAVFCIFIFKFFFYTWHSIKICFLFLTEIIQIFFSMLCFHHFFFNQTISFLFKAALAWAILV